MGVCCIVRLYADAPAEAYVYLYVCVCLYVCLHVFLCLCACLSLSFVDAVWSAVLGGGLRRRRTEEEVKEDQKFGRMGKEESGGCGCWFSVRWLLE